MKRSAATANCPDRAPRWRGPGRPVPRCAILSAEAASRNRKTNHGGPNPCRGLAPRSSFLVFLPHSPHHYLWLLTAPTASCISFLWRDICRPRPRLAESTPHWPFLRPPDTNKIVVRLQAPSRFCLLPSRPSNVSTCVMCDVMHPSVHVYIPLPLLLLLYPTPARPPARLVSCLPHPQLHCTAPHRTHCSPV